MSVSSDPASLHTLAGFTASVTYSIWHSTQLSTTAATPQAFYDFCTKILRMTELSHSVIMLATHYIFKLKQIVQSNAQLGSEFRILAAGLIIATKVLEDNTYSNKSWSIVTGISVQELLVMELEMMKLLNFDLQLSAMEYRNWLFTIKSAISPQSPTPSLPYPSSPVELTRCVRIIQINGQVFALPVIDQPATNSLGQTSFAPTTPTQISPAYLPSTSVPLSLPSTVPSLSFHQPTASSLPYPCTSPTSYVHQAPQIQQHTILHPPVFKKSSPHSSLNHELVQKLTLLPITLLPTAIASHTQTLSNNMNTLAKMNLCDIKYTNSFNMFRPM
ncbi:cyclin-domain-containing protein [Paraphysoderma sedebokerense]|nr:cyclin-domain-containing protein [Paraphysoderma sedebokerense]